LRVDRKAPRLAEVGQDGGHDDEEPDGVPAGLGSAA
jgi:hypothetical protein